MKTRLFLAYFLICAAAASTVRAADPPPVPAGTIDQKKELLFSGDINDADHDKRGHKVVDTFAFEEGALKGTQTRDKTPDKIAMQPRQRLAVSAMET